MWSVEEVLRRLPRPIKVKRTRALADVMCPKEGCGARGQLKIRRTSGHLYVEVDHYITQVKRGHNYHGRWERTCYLGPLRNLIKSPGNP